MISGSHSIIYTRQPEADRAFFRDVLRLPTADAGEGWLIFGLPPSEVAFHPSEKNDLHEFYLICDDIGQFIAAARSHDVQCTPAQDMGWGILTQMTLPGGGKLGVYEPRHPRPKKPPTRQARAKTSERKRPASRRAKPKAKAQPAAAKRKARKVSPNPKKVTSKRTKAPKR